MHERIGTANLNEHVAGPGAAPLRRAAITAYGLLLVALGGLACVFPLAGGLLAGYTLAWAMVAGGIAAIVAGIGHIREHGYWADLVIGVLTTVFGLMVFAFPLIGAVTLLWSLSLWFAIAGVIEIGAAGRFKAGRWLQIGNGILDLGISILLLVEFGRLNWGIVSALVGVSLIVNGVTVLFRTLKPRPHSLP